MELLSSFACLSSVFLKNKKTYLQKKGILFLIKRMVHFLLGCQQVLISVQGKEYDHMAGNKAGGWGSFPNQQRQAVKLAQLSCEISAIARI